MQPRIDGMSPQVFAHKAAGTSHADVVFRVDVFCWYSSDKEQACRSIMM
jgi:hypothetical protein